MSLTAQELSILEALARKVNAIERALAELAPSIEIGTGLFRDNVFTVQDEGDNTKQLQFQASGITTGNTRTLTVPDASGTLALLGLAQTFSALQTFSSGINLGNETLSVYDEGTWTPAITGSGSNPTVSYTTQSGVYRRIGSAVNFTIGLTISSISGGSGDIRISLPFTPAYVAVCAIQTTGVDLTTPVNVAFVAQTAGAYGRIQSTQDNADRVVEQISALANGDSIQASGVFFV